MPDPRFMGKPPQPVTLTGCLLPWYTDSGQPIVLLGPRGESYLLPVFDTEEKLHAAMLWMQPQDPWSIKQIDDGEEFIRSVRVNKQAIIIALNPWRTAEGTTRFQGVFLPEEMDS